MAVWHKEVEALSIRNWGENFLSRFCIATVLTINQYDYQKTIIRTRILSDFDCKLLKKEELELLFRFSFKFNLDWSWFFKDKQNRAICFSSSPSSL